MPLHRRNILISLIGGLLVHRAMGRTPRQAALEQAADTAGMPLANLYGSHVDPALYLVSEKYDGVRALWDGRTLRFRSGRTVAAPASFTARLPNEALDGELWLSRGRFDALSGIVRKETPAHGEWAQVRYMVFDMPRAGGRFDERARELESLVQRMAWPQLQAVAQLRVADRNALLRRLHEVLAQGGEGLMLRLASAPYASGRSDALLKLKPHLDDEATVVGYRAGKGRHAGRLGALQLQTPQGRRFFLGTGLSDALRDDPPPLGSRITYRYRDLTSTGLPRFASFVRVQEQP
jgi:DNA ligase-1